MIVAAYNEETVIERRLENLLALDYPADRLEIVVTSDASDDRTDELVEAVVAREPRVRLIRCPRAGKVAAQDRAVRETNGEIVAFSDANATWSPDTLAKLVRSFADPEVAYVCGRLVLTDAAGSNREGVYWRFETWLRAQESALGSVTGGNGSVYAVRRADYVEVDPRFGHDLSLPYLMVQRGRRAVYDPEALAFEAPTPEIETEYRRKVRMFEHCWLIVLRGRMLRRLPPGYFVEIVSHRHLRYGSGLLHLVRARDERRPRRAAGRRRLRRAARAAARIPGAGRAPARAAALLRARHLGDCRLALELPAPRGAGDLGRGRGDAVTRRGGRRARPRVADQDARQPVPRRTADPLPDPAVPARGRAGARSTRPRLQLGALDDRRRPGRLAGDGDRSGRRSRSVRRAESRSNSAWRPSMSSPTRASFRSPTASFDAVFSYSVLQHLDKEDVPLVVGEIRRVLRPERAGLDRDAERARPAQPRPPGPTRVLRGHRAGRPLLDSGGAARDVRRDRAGVDSRRTAS